MNPELLMHRIEKSLSEPLEKRPIYASESTHLKAALRIANHISCTHPKVSFGSLSSYACKATNEIKIESYFNRPHLCDQQILELHLALTAHEAAHLRWTSLHSFAGWEKIIHNGLEDVRINALLKQTYHRVGDLLDLLYQVSQAESYAPSSRLNVPPMQSAMVCVVLYLQEYPHEWTIEEDETARAMFDVLKPLLKELKDDLVVHCDETALFRHVKTIRRLWRPFLKAKKPLRPNRPNKKRLPAKPSIFDFAASGARSAKDEISHERKDEFKHESAHRKEESSFDIDAIMLALSMAEAEESTSTSDAPTLIQSMERILCEKEQSQGENPRKAKEPIEPIVYRARKKDDVTIIAQKTDHPRREEFLRSMIEQERVLQLITDSFEQQPRWEARTKNGLLDSSRLAHTALREKDVFRKRTPQKQISTAFSILIDASGSMYRGEPEKIDVALETAFVLCLLAERLGIAAEALAFTTVGYEGRCYAKYERSLPLKHIQIKGFEDYLIPEPFLNAREEGGYHNVDGEALEWSGERLLSRTEEQKILLVLSDGSPQANENNESLREHLQQTIHNLRAQGMQIFGFGIQCKDVEEFYSPLCFTVENLKSFIKQGFVAFLRLLLKH